MASLSQQVIVLGLIKKLLEKKGWSGETHIQKCSYFLQNGLGVPLRLEFFLYKHGPFSFELRDLLSEMRASGLLRIESRRPYGGSIQVTDEGKELFEFFSEPISKMYDDQIEFVAARIAPKGVGVVELERLGTALYVRNEDLTKSLEERARRINFLKSHIATKAAEEAVQKVEELLSNAPILSTQ